MARGLSRGHGHVGMVTWTEVIDVTTGRIYADCEEVERRHGVPAKLVDACIQTGKSINGHRFRCVTRQAQGGIPKWLATSGATKRSTGTHKKKSAAPKNATPRGEVPLKDQARAVEMYEQGAKLADISAALGRTVKTRDITRWNGGTTPERPPDFWNRGRGRGININNKRPSWENPPCAPVDGPEGAESDDSLPAPKEAPKSPKNGITASQKDEIGESGW